MPEDNFNPNSYLGSHTLPLFVVKFSIYNTDRKQDDTHDVEIRQLPGETEEKMRERAKFKLGGWTSDRSCYAKQPVKFVSITETKSAI